MGLGVIRYKIWHDLWDNKGRTLRVIAIIVIGAFAVGTTLGGKEFIIKDLARTWQVSQPATIGLSAKPPVSQATIETLEHLRGIETVVGWQQETVKWRPSLEAHWQKALLVAIDDYQDQPIRQIKLDKGDWPHRKYMGIQRGRDLDVGDQIYLEINDKEYQVEMNGILYNAAHPPPFVFPEPMFFTTQERFEQLTGEVRSSLILATIPNYSEVRVQAAADLIQNELEKQNIEVNPAIPRPGGFTTRTSTPDRFIVQDALDGVFLMLTVMAIATLLLGLFLVYNTINAIIVQQINQIGIMKAVGAKFSRILLIYFSTVLVYAVLALLIAIPMGALGAYGLRLAMIGRLKMIPGPFEISSTAVTVQIIVALFSPLIVSIIPIFSGARITVREAISTYGLGGSAGLLDKLLVKIEFLPRIISLTISNTFRNKRRVMLTQVTLVGAGIIFMMVLSTRSTLIYTFSDIIFKIFEANVFLDLKSDERIIELESLTLATPNVKDVEIWSTVKGKIRLLGQPESNEDSEVNLRGIPLPSNTYIPQIRAGRWLHPDDSYAIILNQALATDMGVTVGDWITLDILAKHESEWEIVGLVFEPLDQMTALMPHQTLSTEIGQVGKGKAIKIQTVRGDASSDLNTAIVLKKLYQANGYDVVANTADTSHQVTAQRVEQMSILIALLSGMAIMIAVVGAVALSGTLSINVMERTREIGVMRAIGASSAAVAGQFVGEGLLLGWLSWLIAIPLSVPVGRLVIINLSNLMNIELIYQFSVAGVLYWFVIITVLAVIASWFPAQKAAQTSVRESLAYA